MDHSDLIANGTELARPGFGLTGSQRYTVQTLVDALNTTRADALAEVQQAHSTMPPGEFSLWLALTMENTRG